VAADGYEVSTFQELGDVVAAQLPGASVRLRVHRGPSFQTVEVALD
jgi:S1-C subfamily serine protease